jgi:hypothetical protein
LFVQVDNNSTQSRSDERHHLFGLDRMERLQTKQTHRTSHEASSSQSDGKEEERSSLICNCKVKTSHLCTEKSLCHHPTIRKEIGVDAALTARFSMLFHVCIPFRTARLREVACSCIADPKYKLTRCPTQIPPSFSSRLS